MKNSAAPKTQSMNTLSGKLRLREDKGSSLEPRTAERRVKPRIVEPFPAKVWGIDTGGSAFELDCELDNMSSTGLYVRLPRAMNSGAEINAAIRFLEGQQMSSTALVIGQVLRDELQLDGRHGIAVAIREHHFL